MFAPLTLRIAAVFASAAVIAVPVAANAAPEPAAPTPSAVRLAGGTTKVVVPLAEPAPIRDAAPLVLSGDTPLGFGVIAADRRSVVVETRARVGPPAIVRISWSGGSVPPARSGRPAAPRAAGPGSGTVPDPSIPVAPTGALPTTVGDPGARGPLPTVRAQYTLGDAVLKVPSGYTVELTGEVTYPRTLGKTRHPVVVLLHGRHSACGRKDGATDDRWPCTGGYRRIPSEQGYRTLADLLASHGDVVVSVAANGITANDDTAADAGARDRGFLVMRHLDLWRGWSTTTMTGPFGAKFRGALDLARVGLMGHSRGGEGVVSALAQNRGTGSRYGIKAVVPLAPVNFTRQSVRGTPSLTLVPYCDGDVSDLEGVHFFDDATTGRVDGAPHALLGVLGANHNFFNTVWTPGGWEAGTGDDWSAEEDPFCGRTSGRLTPKQQVAAGSAYIAAFLLARLQGKTGYDALFLGNAKTPASAAPAKTVTAWSAPAGRRLLVNDLRSATSNALGGAVRATGFDAAQSCGGTTRYALTCIAPRGQGDEPHLGRSLLAPRAPGLSQVHLIWSRAGSTWSNTLPAAHRDVAGYRYVTVRLTKDVWAFSAVPPAVGLRLRDAAGKVRTVRLAGAALNTPVYTAPTGSGMAGLPAPHALVMSAPVPLAAFNGVDLRRIASVSVVGLGDRGDITVGDVSFQR